MKLNDKLLIAVLAGLVVGAAGQSAMHGQQVKALPVYVISEAETIRDATAVTSYGTKVQETLRPFNGHYHFVVTGSKVESLDGDAPPKGIVVIAFDSTEQAQAWYTSPAYEAIRPIRLAAVKGRMFTVEGAAQ